MTYTNEQLKRTLAKMFPEKVKHTSILVWTTPINYCCEVRDTELLQLCWDVEDDLADETFSHYAWDLLECVEGHKLESKAYLHATWQQRTIALAQTLGIEIV